MSKAVLQDGKTITEGSFTVTSNSDGTAVTAALLKGSNGEEISELMITTDKAIFYTELEDAVPAANSSSGHLVTSSSTFVIRNKQNIKNFRAITASADSQCFASGRTNIGY